MESITVERNPSPAKLDAMGVEYWAIWEKEVSTFEWTYDANEKCYILEGEAIVTPKGGEPVEINAQGLLAIVLQHEIDHLNGKLYIDRADLTTLRWVDNDEESGLPVDKDAFLDEIQTIYQERFHQNKESIVFEQ